MKKLVVLLCVVMLLFTGCDESAGTSSIGSATEDTIVSLDGTDNAPKTNKRVTAKEDSGMVVISEKMYMTEINDIFTNFSDYEGKTIKVEGMYDEWDNYDGTMTHAVYRSGPGCCGYDGWGGFFLNYDGQYPNKNDWIEVIGTPKLVKKEYNDDIYLDVTSLIVKDERGKEFCYQ